MTAMTRLATAADCPVIAEIYNQGIATRMATFETQPRVAADVEAWLDAGLIVMVVEEAGSVLAFASTSTYRARPCYGGVREFSVYVSEGSRGRGHGLLALEALSEEAARRGCWKLLSRVFAENAASRRLCVKAGFREVGVYRRHAKLDGEWRDCVIVEKLIGEGAT